MSLPRHPPKANAYTSPSHPLGGMASRVFFFAFSLPFFQRVFHTSPFPPPLPPSASDDTCLFLCRHFRHSMQKRAIPPACRIASFLRPLDGILPCQSEFLPQNSAVMAMRILLLFSPPVPIRRALFSFLCSCFRSLPPRITPLTSPPAFPATHCPDLRF